MLRLSDICLLKAACWWMAFRRTLDFRFWELQVNLPQNVAPRKRRQEVRTHNRSVFLNTNFFFPPCCNLLHPCDYSLAGFKEKEIWDSHKREEPFMETSIWEQIYEVFWDQNNCCDEAPGKATPTQLHASPHPNPYPEHYWGLGKKWMQKDAQMEGFQEAFTVETWIKPSFLCRVSEIELSYSLRAGLLFFFFFF